MVRPRTVPEDRDRDMAQAGARFETYVKAAMAEAKLPTLAELYRKSGIGASTWNAWFNGKREPRGNSLRLAGAPLHKTPEQLRAVWDGDRPQKPRRPTETGDQVAGAIREQTAMLREVLEAIIGRLPPQDVLDIVDREVPAAERALGETLPKPSPPRSRDRRRRVEDPQ